MALPWLWSRLLWAVATTLVGGRMAWAEPGVNITLLFHSVSHSNSLRSCRCGQPVADCDEALANLKCSCQTLTPAGPRQNYASRGTLSVWVRDPWLLWDWLSGVEVWDLRVCVCSPPPPALPLPPLLLLGLRRLNLLPYGHQGEPWRQQSLLLQPHAPAEPHSHHQGEPHAPAEPHSHHQGEPHLVLLDAAALTGESALRSYSVITSAADTHAHTHELTHTLTQHFQQLTLPHTHTSDTQRLCLLTFVY
ncbi:uncharacterized protein C21orf62-like isoform X2 [Alosa sapidissima]|nr:uncharacterized protein C21orf62-like isoform X2 [Alosa sapidissima]